MKKAIFCLLMLVASTGFAQDAQIIKKDFQTIIEHTKKLEVDKVLDMSYPPLFKVMPKDQMAAMAKGALTSMGIKTVYEQVPLDLKLSPVKKLKAATICLGGYDQSMILESSKPAMLDMMMQAKMKDISVTKVSPNKIRMKGRQYLLAIKDSHTNSTWKYLRLDEQNNALNEKVLSKEILDNVESLKAGIK